MLKYNRCPVDEDPPEHPKPKPVTPDNTNG